MLNSDLSQNQEEIQNLYAYDIKDNIIYIDNAISGRKGYYCMGCKREMQAVKFKIQKYQSYFRHDAQAVKHTGKCTYSDETYRHKIAKEFLQMTKRIRVPAIYKFSPDGKGLAYKISESEVIEAHEVRNELSFYEDNYGNIKWGGNDEDDDKNLLIRPDVTFFNNLGKPVLFIEIVATHKPNSEKLLKLLRLGINTVSVTIPRDSPENIEQTFSNTKRTKWIYNYEQESTEYIQFSQSGAEGILHLDEEQRKLFAESTKCKKAHINNLIRTIRVCLESEQFREITGKIKSELSRVERNTEELKRDIERKVEVFGDPIEKAESYEIREFNSARNGIEENIREVKSRYQNLERRYNTKRRELEEKGRILDDGILKAERNFGGTGANFERRRTTNLKRREDFQRNAASTTESLNQLLYASKSESRDAEENKSRLSTEFEQLNQEAERAITENQRSRERLPSKYQAIEAELRAEFETKNRDIDKAIISENFGGIPELSERVQRFDDARGLLYNLIQNQSVSKRNRAIREFLKSGMFKTWM